jgi:hypothetical protein
MVARVAPGNGPWKRREVMLIADLIHSCSNEKVAQAALTCIGGRFAERVSVCAREKGMTSGAFVAAVIYRFARRADTASQDALREKMTGYDQPILEGLRALLESALADNRELGEEDAALATMAAAGAQYAQSLGTH